MADNWCHWCENPISDCECYDGEDSAWDEEEWWDEDDYDLPGSNVEQL